MALRSVALGVIDGDGAIVLERSLACEVDEIARCLHELGHRMEWIGFESGTMSQALFHGLPAAGVQLSVWKRGM